VLARWLRRDPDSAEALLWKARLAIADRLPDEAAEALTRAKERGADRRRLARLNAVAEALAGRRAQVEPFIRDEFNADQEPDPLLDEVLARVYLEGYDLPRAGVALARWMRDAPNDPKPYLWRAEIDTRRQDATATASDYREVLKRDPRSAKAWIGLAELLRTTHRTEEAAEAFGRYLALRPDDADGHLGAGRTAAEAGDTDAALRHLERAAVLAPDNAEAHRAVADLLTRRGDVDAALRHIDRARALDPYDLPTRHSRSLLLARLGRQDEAQAEQEGAKRLRADLAGLSAAQNRLVTAPKDREAQLTVARWMFSHGKADDGVRWAEAILRDQPDQPDACRLLADHYSRTGQPGRANYYRALGGPATAPVRAEAR
jgi:tetratricopeptide (TPR) repeat protein